MLELSRDTSASYHSSFFVPSSSLTHNNRTYHYHIDTYIDTHIDTHIHTDININDKHKVNLSQITKGLNIVDFWFNVFLFIYVEPKLNHSFNNNYFNHNLYFKLLTNSESLNELFNFTNNKLLYNDINNNNNNNNNNNSDSNYYFHDLLLIQRSIYTLYFVKKYNKNNKMINILLNTINNKIFLFKNSSLYLSLIYYNIHLSKSAGTTICRTFKKNNIGVDKHNCNIIPYNGPMFLSKNRDLGPISCDKIYKIARKNNYKLIARESPMHGNAISKYPDLCNNFIYLFPFRSPIERILSAIQMMYELQNKQLNSINIFPKLLHLTTTTTTKTTRKTKKTAKKPAKKSWNHEKWRNDFIDKDIFYKFFIEKKFSEKEWKNNKAFKLLIGYLSNAVTRFIGYFNKNIDKTYNSMYIHHDKINDPSNDINFYYAIKYLIKCDYILPFSAIHDNDNDNDQLIDLKINNSPIWNLLINDMLIHLKLNQNKSYKNNFVFGHIDNKTGFRKQLMTSLSENDINAIKTYNYFDLKLFQISKWIAFLDTHKL